MEDDNDEQNALNDEQNALWEFTAAVNSRKVKCADIQLGFYLNNPTNYRLCVGYTANEYQHFLKSLDFTYDAGYGLQELFGYIWFDDGTWAERYEYDGKECWVHKQLPIIPDYLRM